MPPMGGAQLSQADLDRRGWRRCPGISELPAQRVRQFLQIGGAETGRGCGGPRLLDIDAEASNRAFAYPTGGTAGR